MSDAITNGYLLVGICIVLFVIVMRAAYKYTADQKAKKASTMAQYANQPGFLMSSSEDLGGGLVQLHGTASGISLKTGMEIAIVSLGKREIMEVYDGLAERPDEPASELPVGHVGTIVFKALPSDFNILRSQNNIFIEATEVNS